MPIGNTSAGSSDAGDSGPAAASESTSGSRESAGAGSGARSPSRYRSARGAAFGIASQLLNAGTNVATAYLASLFLRPGDFGSFALNFALVTFLLAAGRGLIGSTLLVHLPTAPEAARPALARSAIGFALVVGIIAALSLFVASIWFPTLLWFAPWVTIALLHDVGRYIFLSRGLRSLALTLDAVWAGAQLVFVASFWVSGTPLTVGVLASGWGIGALSGVLVFAVIAFPFARPADPRPWFHATKDLAGWFTALSTMGQLEIYLVLTLAGALLGSTDAGGLRAVQLLVYQPPLVLSGALMALAVPPIARLGAESPRLAAAWRRIVFAVSPIAAGVLGVSAASYPIMELLFPQYVGYSVLALPIALQSVGVTLAMPTSALLNGTRRGALAFLLHTVRTALIVGLVAIGALTAGPTGLAWGLAAGGVIVLVLMSATTARLLSKDRRPVHV